MLQDDTITIGRLLHSIETEGIENADILYFKKGEIIYFEGSSPLGIYIVQTGKVKISKLGCSGKEKIIRIVTSEEILNYADMLCNRRYSNTGKTLEDTSLKFISKQQFWNVMQKQQFLFEQFMQQISKDMRYIEQNNVDLAYTPVRGRLASALLYLDRKFNTNMPGLHYISITRTDLAGFIGTVKETANRLLSEFREEHLIQTEGSRINILDPEGLKKISKIYH